MKTTNAPILRFSMMILALAALVGFKPTQARATSRVVVTASADVRVWLDDTYDVFPSYDDVVISLRAERDCYTTVFVVDTDGFVHIVYPFSRRHNAWVRGGRVYRYTARELGLASLDGRGVAHVFAISSPIPFDYAGYDDEIFLGGCGYRIYGDPFVACREIYISLLPVSCRWDVIGVSFARFYIREWSRYPHYLCRGHHGVHVRVGDYCSSCARLYDGYRVHVADPYVVIHPRVRFEHNTRDYAEVKRSTRKYKSVSNDDRNEGRDRVVSRSSTGREAVAGWTRAKTVSTSRPSPAIKSARPAKAVPSVRQSQPVTRTKPAAGVKSTPARTVTRSVKSAKPATAVKSTSRSASKATTTKKGATSRGSTKSKKAR